MDVYKEEKKTKKKKTQLVSIWNRFLDKQAAQQESVWLACPKLRVILNS